jgi:hypothetical protein
MASDLFSMSLTVTAENWGLEVYFSILCTIHSRYPFLLIPTLLHDLSWPVVRVNLSFLEVYRCFSSGCVGNDFLEFLLWTLCISKRPSKQHSC